MKLTWFGATALRVHLGGKMVLLDAQAAQGTVDRTELVSGIDLEIALKEAEMGLPRVDLESWRPPRQARTIDADDETPPVIAGSGGPGVVLLHAQGEPPLIVLWGGIPPRFGCWAEGAVLVFLDYGARLPQAGQALLAAARPRLIALGDGEAAVDAAFAALAPVLDGASLVALEPALALEV